MKAQDRSLQLPEPVAAYFAADDGDSESLSRCFTENAVVKDEAHTHTGRQAIRKWSEEAMAKYAYRSEPLSCEVKEAKAVVTTRITGNFPGSPIELRFHFGIEGNKIASLEVVP